MVCLPLTIQTDVLVAVSLRAVDLRGEGARGDKDTNDGGQPGGPLTRFPRLPSPLSSHIDSPQIHRREYVGLNG